jgi:dephospho-CoA kinase
VVGIVGRAGSGKDTLGEYLADRHEVTVLSLGDVVRRVAVWRGVAATREKLRQISEQLRRQKGPAVFVRHVIRQIDRQSWPAVAVSGIRTPTDVAVFREHYGDRFTLVHVAVGDPHTRFERVRQRDESRDPETFNEFQVEERAEEEEFHISETIATADVVIRNQGSLDEFHERVEMQLVPRLRLPR